MMEKSKYLDKSDIKYIIITFMYVFYFKLQTIPVFSKIDSTIFMGGVFALFLLIFPAYRVCCINLAKKGTTIVLLTSCTMLIILAVIITSIHGEFEFSICKPLVHQLIFLMVGIMFYSYLQYCSRSEYLVEYILICYAIQSVIQYLAFLVPWFNTFTDIFKTAEIIELKKQYDGFRLNAISGGLAFSLAGAYAVVITIFVFRWSELKIRFRYLTLILLLAGGLAAGRTAILLALVAILCRGTIWVFQNWIDAKIRRSTIFIFSLLPLLCVMAILILPLLSSKISQEFLTKLDTIAYWLTKWTSEYFRFGDTGSTYDFWETNYSVFKNIRNPLLGDGIFTNHDGTYYLGQDAGYIRMLAFGGVVWSIALLVHQFILVSSCRYRKGESLVVFFLIIIGTLKADCLGIDLQIILVLAVLFFDSHFTSELQKGQ